MYSTREDSNGESERNVFFPNCILSDAHINIVTKNSSVMLANSAFRTIAIDDNADPSKGRADLILRCDNDNNGPWKCEVEAGHYFLRTDGTYFDYFKEVLHTFR